MEVGDSAQPSEARQSKMKKHQRSRAGESASRVQDEESSRMDWERDRKWNQKKHKLVDVDAALTLVYREGSEKSAQRSLPSGERSEPSRRVCEVRTVNGATFIFLYSLPFREGEPV